MARNNDAQVSDMGEQQAAEVAVFTNTTMLAQFAEMVTMIPADTEDAAEQILITLLQAGSWEALNAPWESSSVDDIKGKTLKLTGAKRLPSTYAGGLGMFLVVFLTDPKDGKQYVKTTSSLSVIGAVVAAYARDWMPLLVQWHVADRPSRAGFYPQHLKIVDAMGDGVEQGGAS